MSVLLGSFEELPAYHPYRAQQSLPIRCARSDIYARLNRLSGQTRIWTWICHAQAYDEWVLESPGWAAYPAADRDVWMMAWLIPRQA
ncbi:hypothetical protein ACETRX_34405 [Labrys portucalensis]|uniref:Uncharacterized protein n=1 Tax=Labrys neptuniae TaxID=376174 RepID=A0ABV6ZRE5_9HYPH